MKVRIFIAIVSILLCLAVGFAAIYLQTDLIKQEEKPTYVFSVWGDSIAESVLGASPIGERDGYAYSSIVGRVANFEFHNRSVSGHLTSQMYDYITAPDDGARMNNTLLKTSDIIGISILGNDLLQNDISYMSVAYAKGDTEVLDYHCAQAKVDLYKVLDYIKEVNPNAKVLMQTVYNPMYVGSVILKATAYEELEALGVTDEQIREFGGEMLARLNQAVYDYDKDHPGAITIIDVNKRFDEIFQANPEIGKELLYNDGVHPSNEGHAVIAELYLEALTELGFVDSDKALAKYKDIRVDQLNRLYTEANSINVKHEIRKADSFNEVTNTYFRFVQDKTPVLNKRATEGNPYTAFEQTEKFYISDANVFGLPVGLFLDSENSYIEFYTDGTMKIQIMLPEGASDLVGTLLGDVDLSTFEVAPIINQYAVELFPGFTLSDVKYSLGLLEDNLDLSFIGLDYEHEGVKALVDSLEQEGKLPETLSIPEGLGVQFTGRYTIREVTNELTGEAMTAIHMGAPYENGDGYVIMDLTDDVVSFNIDFLQMHVEGVK